MATALLERNSTSPDGPDGHRHISDAELEELTGMVRREYERRGIAVGLPDNMPSTQDLEAQRAHEAGQTNEERKTELREQLEAQRAHLVELAARRSGRVHSGKNSSLTEEYEGYLATYKATFGKLTQLEHPEWKLTGNETVEQVNRKTEEATLHYMEHLTELREATSEQLQGTRIGKIVTHFNSGSRLRRFVRYTAVAAAAAAAGAVVIATGVGAGLAIGGAIGGTTRFVRGAMRAEGDRTVGQGVGWRGKKNKAVHDSGIFEDAFKTSDGKLDLADAGAAAMATIFNKDIQDQQSQRRRSLGWGAVSVAGGAVAGHAVEMAADKLGFGGTQASAAPQAGQEGGPTPGSAAHANLADRQSVVEWEEMMKDWRYNPAENPFYAPGKTGIHDLGPALKADAALDAGKPAGWHDLTQNRWTNSPEQFASICAALGLDGMADEAGAINGLSDRFKLDPMVYQDKHEAVMAIMNDPTTKIEGPIPIQSTISSEYGVDMGNGNMDLAKDDYVDNANKGTKMLISFKDPNTGAFRTIELRCECGGQRMIEHPMPVYEPEPEYVPQGGGYVPQGGGNPEYIPQEQPQYSEPQPEPQGGGNPPTTTPPTTTPPTTTPPTVNPPTTNPPVSPKNPAEAPQANPAVADFGKNLLGELFGNSEARPYNSAPPKYDAPGPATSNETVPGSGPKLDTPKPAPAAPNVTSPGGATTRVTE